MPLFHYKTTVVMLSQTVKHSLICKILADSWHTIINHLFCDDYSLQPYHRQWHYWYISGTQLFLSTDASFQYLVKRLLTRPLMCQAEQSCSLPATGQDCWLGCWCVRQIIAVHSQSLAQRLLTCRAKQSCSLPVTGPETVDEGVELSGRV